MYHFVMCFVRKWLFMNLAVLFYLIPFFVLMVLSNGGDGIESFVSSEFGAGPRLSHFVASLLLMQPTVLLLLGRRVLWKIWKPLAVT